MLLRVDAVSQHFGGVKAVDDVSFDVAEGQIAALIGPNGAGKTTLLNVVSGFLRPDTGTLRFQGQAIGSFPPHRRAALGIARTFQHVQLLSQRSVLENVMVGAHLSGRSGIPGTVLRTVSFKREEADIEDAAMRALALGGIQHLAYDVVERLSYGLQRRVEVARAIAMRPRLLLMDEPAAGLNDAETEELGRMITGLRDTGVTVLLVEHAMPLVMSISDHVVVLEYGRKLAQGSVDVIRHDPKVIDAYLGQDEH